MAIIEFNIPTKITFGVDSLDCLSDTIKKYGGRTVLVTDGASFNQTGLIDQIVNKLNDNFINVMVYSDVNSTSTSDAADIIANLVRYSRAESIVAVGGFKIQNTAKGAAIVVTNSGEASDYINGQPVYHKPLPIIAVPTILGSLSEIATGVCLYDKYDEVNKQNNESNIYSSNCIIDPTLYATVPVKYTISSALSVFALSFDIYMSNTLTSITEPLIVHAMKVSMQGLKKLISESNNIDNITTLATANMLCSTSACHSSLGAIRALSIAINSVYAVNKSMVCSILLPHIMEYYITVAPDKYVVLSNVIDGIDPEMTPFEIANQSAQHIKQFLHNINLPTRLNEINIDRSKFDKVAELALKYPGMDQLPRTMNFDSIMTILEQAY
ncbi:iron-containing alcohol dehydrogenase [Brachyspira hampsonii]|uniref:Alcohol dehydrogenase n=1 Tax=Brachyspira hampsonii TaxID=1287055 RepID=A0AAC9TSS7_9SPIR|nr:iron-containing alcohol dehydrogenase [Brachyspira hampsonii]ASJ21181.1 alcohol dehydrogenase [Brachyspira hampsonii]ELV05357.1 alcohol dehydrogenase [Brachyspira hampsonii 30599]MBW5381665.1 iron-containing alcohol dehydrogenase [Brachyspira hampsonii]MBW5410674.1 iron-containing alcohol dehydrogenase [Brachyspira hampsonii]OEJ17528.1 alcohol dehydrogenase [Brachyspira hampsonii]